MDTLDYTSPKLDHADALDIVVHADEGFYSMVYLSSEGSLLRNIHRDSYPPKHPEGIHPNHVKQRLIRVSTPFTLIPTDDFDESRVQEIAAEAFKYDKFDLIYAFKQDEISGIYHVTKALQEKLDTWFKDYTIQHTTDVLLKLQNHHTASVLAHWTERGLILLAFNQGLQLANYYSIEAPEDAVYYILSAYNHVGIDPLDEPLQMSGNIDMGGRYFDFLQGFVKNFDWKKQGISIPSDVNVPPHLLHHMQICE